MPDVLSRSTFIAAYLDRIRVEPPSTLDLHALNALQVAHLRHVPVDNSGLVLGQRDTQSAVAHVLLQKRGAAATTLNVLFGLLLTGLGFHTRLIATTGSRSATLTPQAVIGVRLDGTWYIADVSGASGDAALPLDTATHQRHRSPSDAVSRPSGARNDAGAASVRYRILPEENVVESLAFWEERTELRTEARARALIATVRRQHGWTTLIGTVLEERSGEGLTRIQLEPSQIPGVLHERFGISLNHDEAHRLRSVVRRPD